MLMLYFTKLAPKGDIFTCGFAIHENITYVAHLVKYNIIVH